MPAKPGKPETFAFISSLYARKDLAYSRPEQALSPHVPAILWATLHPPIDAKWDSPPSDSAGKACNTLLTYSLVTPFTTLLSFSSIKLQKITFKPFSTARL